MNNPIVKPYCPAPAGGYPMVPEVGFGNYLIKSWSHTGGNNGGAIFPTFNVVPDSDVTADRTYGIASIIVTSAIKSWTYFAGQPNAIALAFCNRGQTSFTVKDPQTVGATLLNSVDTALIACHIAIPTGNSTINGAVHRTTAISFPKDALLRWDSGRTIQCFTVSPDVSVRFHATFTFILVPSLT